jgi:hypothetical protein
MGFWLGSAVLSPIINKFFGQARIINPRPLRVRIASRSASDKDPMAHFGSVEVRYCTGFLANLPESVYNKALIVIIFLERRSWTAISAPAFQWRVRRKVHQLTHEPKQSQFPTNLCQE